MKKDNRKNEINRTIKSLVRMGKKFWSVALLGLVNTYFEKIFDLNNEIVNTIYTVLPYLLCITIILCVILSIINHKEISVKTLPVKTNDNDLPANNTETELTLKKTEDELSLIFKQKGIVGIYDEGEGYSIINSKLEGANSKIDFIAYHGDGFLKIHKELLVRKAENGVVIRFLVANKKSILIDETRALETLSNKYKTNIETNNHLGGSVRDFIDDINTVLEIKGCKINFNCRFYNTEVRYALTIIDEKWAWWTPYHTGIITEKTPSFALTKKIENGTKTVPFIDYCQKHFDKVWDNYAE